jgi:hypothetical protein
MPQDPLDPELEAVESALGRLAPARSRLDRDRLMFEAGVLSVRSGSRRGWVWPSIAAGLAVMAVSESFVLATRPDPHVVVVRQEAAPARRAVEPEPVQILVGGRPSASQEEDSRIGGGGEGLGLRRQVLRFGIEGLPDPSLLTQSGSTDAAPREVPEAAEPLRRYELNKVLNPGGPS